jgi:hypothetical protein
VRQVGHLPRILIVLISSIRIHQKLQNVTKFKREHSQSTGIMYVTITYYAVIQKILKNYYTFMIHQQMTLRPLLFYGVTWHRLTVGYQHFRSAYQSHLQGQAVEVTCQMTKHLNNMVTEA